MKLFTRLPRRRKPLPEQVKQQLALEHGEHVLAHAVTKDEAYVVATDRAAYLPSADGLLRVGWEQVARATWRDEVLTLSETGEPGTSPPVHRVRLAQPYGLPDVVHDRVTSTIVVSQHVPLEIGGGVRLIARRQPGAPPEAEPSWSMSFDRGVDPSDPAVVDAAIQALADLRRQMGV